MRKAVGQRVIAILCADLHLSMKAPLARTSEPDWFAAMKGPLDQLGRLAEQNHCPILCAGDIFDRWNPPPELVNFALDHLPDMIAVPGQHDLPYHDFGQLERCGFCTLMKAGKIRLVGQKGIRGEGFDVYGVPWEMEIPEVVTDDPQRLAVALIHGFVWEGKKTMYPGAQMNENVSAWRRKLGSYDVAVFGDNHIAFSSEKTGKKPLIFNCGALMRRRANEIGYRPRVGLLYRDGALGSVDLDITGELIERVEETVIDESMDLREFVIELGRLENDPLDFAEAVKRYVAGRPSGDLVGQVLMEAMES